MGRQHFGIDQQRQTPNRNLAQIQAQTLLVGL
jgi:hypothetical protein